MFKVYISESSYKSIIQAFEATAVAVVKRR